MRTETLDFSNHFSTTGCRLPYWLSIRGECPFDVLEGNKAQSYARNQHITSKRRRNETWTYSFASGELFGGAKVVDAMTGDIGAS